MKKPNQLKSGSGFSLVELLVVIAVIAIIAAIAIPNIANITQSADAATQVRNAQQLASTWNNYVEAVVASGAAAPSTVPSTSDIILDTPVDVPNTRLGTTVTFGLPGLTAGQVDWSKITTNGSYLQYDPGS